MHTAIVALLTMILPLAGAIIAWASGQTPGNALAQSFAFWAVGIRLLTAGLSQALQPRFTSETIFGVTDPAARGLAREIGFGNLALGALGTASAAFPSWVAPAVFTGAAFYSLAGIAHLARRRGRGPKRSLAMASDLFAAGGLWIGLVWMAVD